MAIDSLSIRKSRQKELEDFLTVGLPESTERDIERSRAETENIRERILGRGQEDLLSSVRSEFNLPQVQLRPATQPLRRNLERESEAFIADRQRRSVINKMNLMFNTVFDFLVERGMDVRRAQEFSRQYVADQIDREFRGLEQSKEREFALEQDRLAGVYGNAETDIVRSLDLNPSIQNALLRSLLGFGGTLGTGLITSGLNKKREQLYPTPSYLTAMTSGIPTTAGLMERKPFNISDIGLSRKTMFGRRFAGQALGAE